MNDLQAVRVTAEGIARRAGDVLRGFYGGAHDEHIKLNMADIVTEGDTASEAVIVSLLRAAFPAHGIISEEGADGDAPSAYTLAWHIDPIDGTTNFSKNMPHFCLSIALADADLNPLVGVVYAPALDELFSAARGQGATLNGAPIQVSAVSHSEQAVILTGFPASARDSRDLERFVRLARQVRAGRVQGAAALDLCFVAMGRCEAFWEGPIHTWDVLAGALIVEEAGGRVTDFSGGRGRTAYSGAEVLASNGHLHAWMIDQLAAHGAKPSNVA
ncbi:MAG: inositol monophosphatase family protein [bacterium]|nr:inositol monophosphatase family protein [bacterium]